MNEILKISNIHADKINLAILRLEYIFPLNKEKVESFSEQEMMAIELLISRFAKLQDYIGRILINEVLKKAGDYDERFTMIDKINKLEKLRIIESAEIWHAMREARNHVSHEYPDEPSLTARYLNQIFDFAPKLIDTLNKMQLYIK
jgi:hypothetical protein